MVLYKTLYRDIERIYYIFSLIHIFPTHISLVRRSIIIVLLSFYHHRIHPKLRLRDEMPKGLISLWIIGQVITRFLPDYYNCEKSNSFEIGHDHLFYMKCILRKIQVIHIDLFQDGIMINLRLINPVT